MHYETSLVNTTVGCKCNRRHNPTEKQEQKKQSILTSDHTHTDHMTIGKFVSRHSLTTLLHFLFSPEHILLIQFYCHRTNGTFGFAQNTSRHIAKPKEPIFASAPNDVTENINLNLASFQRLLLATETVKNHNYVGR